MVELSLGGKTATVYIDGRPYLADPARNLLDVCLSLGMDLPYFCWHPALGSVGACRQCAVTQYRDEKDREGKIVMACMTPAKDGARIALEDEGSRKFRASVIEWLMTNHPHDCPVCEEGGECHLQDMTLMSGHVYRRYRFTKRTFRNQDLGPFLNHEMNRCITCYRCVRFYQDYAGGHDLQAFASRNRVYFGRESDGVLENEFAGNLAEVCPTGVFTDRPFGARYTRKWDLESAPSVCVHCSLGCNIHPNARQGELRRVLNRFNSAVNGYFLCDRGRFGYDFANSTDRIRRPILRNGVDVAGPVTATVAVQRLGALVAEGRAIGIGSPRASLEANFALRALVGPTHFYAGVSRHEHALINRVRETLKAIPIGSASIEDAGQADAILVLGEDLPNTAPRLALALRQAVRQAAFELADRLRVARWQDATVRDAARDLRSPLFISTPAPTRLDDAATQTLRAAPDDIARLGFAVAHAIDPAAPPVPDLDENTRALAQTIAQAMLNAKRPLVVGGTSAGSLGLIEAAANIANAMHAMHRRAHMSFVLPECNSMGLALFEAGDLDDALAAIENGAASTLVVLENDLYRRAPGASIDRAFAGVSNLVAIDSLKSATTVRADLLLPGATFAEGDGTLVNAEGRAQRFFQVFVPDNDVQESWRFLRDALPNPLAWRNLDDVTRACAQAIPVLAPIVDAAPPATFREAGQKIPRLPHRASGRTAITANISVHEPRPPDDPDSALAFSMEGSQQKPPAAVVPFFWAPRWNSIQSLNKFQEEIGGPLREGPAGVRLFESVAAATVPYCSDIPPPFLPRAKEWLVVALPQIFGSEELSQRSRPIAARAGKPYLALAPGPDIDLRDDDLVTVTVAATQLRVHVRIDASLARGVAGITTGFPGLVGLALPAFGRIEKVAT